MVFLSLEEIAAKISRTVDLSSFVIRLGVFVRFEFADYEVKVQTEDLLSHQDRAQALSRASAQMGNTFLTHGLVKIKPQTQKWVW